jgi:hypothetical protein
VAGVGGRGALPCRRERLARARSGPDRTILGPSGQGKRVRPSSDPGEEVALNKPGKVGCVHVGDAAVIHLSRRDEAGRHQVPQPGGGEPVVLVIVMALHDE